MYGESISQNCRTALTLWCVLSSDMLDDTLLRRGGGGVGRSGGLYVRPLGEERRVPLDANDGPERCPPHERERAWQQAHL